MSRFTWLAAAALLGVALGPQVGAAQSCDNCNVYAVDALNVRQSPNSDSTVLTSVPAGGEVWRRAAGTIDGYAPVAYGDVWGWVVDSGLSAQPVDTTSTEQPAPDATNGDAATRATLASINLRSGPSADDPVIQAVPQGALVTLTYQGNENGYVTVDYQGATGWMYADLLGDPSTAQATDTPAADTSSADTSGTDTSGADTSTTDTPATDTSSSDAPAASDQAPAA